MAQGKWPYLFSWACASQSSLMWHLPAPGQPFSAGACSLPCHTLTAHTFAIPLPCHVLSETTCCHSGPFTGQATTFPFCPLFLSLAPSHFSSSSLFSFNQALTHRTLQPLLNTSFLSLPNLYCFHFSSIGPWDAPLPTALPPTLCGHWMPLCPLSLSERFLRPSSHSPAHSTLSILFSTQSSLLNKSPHHPTFDGHPSLCPSVPTSSSQTRPITTLLSKVPSFPASLGESLHHILDHQPSQPS